MSSQTDMNVDTILQMCEIKSDEKVLGINLAMKLETYHQQLSTIAEFAPLYDSKTGVKANGFRTFVKVLSLRPPFHYLASSFLAKCSLTLL